MIKVITPGLAIDYQDVGQGKPIVLLHGFPLTHAMWAPQIAALQTDYRVLAPNARGFGGTGGFTDTPSIAQMADDVQALLDHLTIREPVVVCGLSMGGYVALAFARKHAARLRGLILADTRAEPDDDAGKAGRDKMMEFARTHSAGDVIDQMIPKLVADSTRTGKPEVVESVRRMGAEQSIPGIVDGLLALRNRPDARPGLADIAVPTLVLVGSRDLLTPPAVARTLSAGIPGARLVPIEDAGHLSNLEQPAAFNQAVSTFLSSLP